MRNYKLTIAYDGSRYQGWQRQATTDNTIQYIMEWSLGRIVGYRVQVDGSGRTDSGVHARGQVASVKLSGLYEPDELKAALNRYLPEDIRVLKVELVKNNFHARKSAKGKKYEYYIDCREKPDVFSRRYCYHYPEKLDIEAMRDAVKYLIGVKNFASFTDNKETNDLQYQDRALRGESEDHLLWFRFSLPYGAYPDRDADRDRDRTAGCQQAPGGHSGGGPQPGGISRSGQRPVFEKSILLDGK